MKTLEEIIHRLETASRKPDLLAAMQMATTGLGFRAFSATLRLVQFEGGATRMILSSLPGEYLAWYEQQGAAEHDTLLHRAFASITPVRCDEALVPGAANDALGALARHGLQPALYCAEHGCSGSTTIAAFYTGERRDVGEVEAQAASWIAAHLHEALDRVLVRPIEEKLRVGSLTRIEQSMLELLARGYGAKEISRMLLVSTRAVRYYADRVREKLGARSLNHALKCAIESRQVSLSGSILPSRAGGTPKLVLAHDAISPWSIEEPSFEMSLREVRSSAKLPALAQAARHAVAALGFRRFAFAFRAPAPRGASQFLLTNDDGVQGGWDDPGPLIGACLRPRPRDMRNVPVFRDEVLRDRSAAAHVNGDSVPELRATSVAADGTAVVCAVAGPEAARGRGSVRREFFQLVRQMHESCARIVRDHVPGLSHPEQAALLQMGRGATIRRVAKAQGQKERTVRYRVGRVAEKLGARNARHALAIATERGLLRREMGRVSSRDLVAPGSLVA